MEQQLTVLLIEDDIVECHEISKYVDLRSDVSLVGITNNITNASNYLLDYKPDAIILDLELYEGKGNGLIFLNNIKNLCLDYIPFILVTTNNNSKIIHKQARNLGADFIISKSQEDYCAQNVIEFLRLLKQTIQSSKKVICNFPSFSTSVSPETSIKRIEKRISTELDIIGISPKVIGRRYLLDAIQLIHKNSSIKVCPIIASKYQKTDTSVERAMQNAINQAWRTSNIEDLCKNYTAHIHSDKGVPTYSEFIFYYADKINQQY